MKRAFVVVLAGIVSIVVPPTAAPKTDALLVPISGLAAKQSVGPSGLTEVVAVDRREKRFSGSEVITLYDAATWKEIHMFPGGSAYFNEGEKLLRWEGGDPKTVILYDVGKRSELKRYQADTAEFGPGRKLIKVGNYTDKTVTLWPADGGNGKTFPDYWARFSPDGRILQSSDDKTRTITLFDVSSVDWTGWSTLKSFTGDAGDFDDESRLFVLSDDRTRDVRVYDMATWKELKRLDGGYGFFKGKYFALLDQMSKTGSLAKTITLYDPATWKKIKAFKGDMQFLSADGKILFVMSRKAGTTTLYDTATWKEIKSFEGCSPELSPDGKMLKMGTWSKHAVTLYDMATWAPIATFGADFSFSGSPFAYFSPDSRLFAAADDKTKTVVVYDVAARKEVATFKGRTNGFSVDGKMLDVSDWDARTTTIYETASWKKARIFEGYPGGFSPDGLVFKVEERLKPFAELGITKKGEFETAKEYEARMAGWEAGYFAAAALGPYDADRGGFEAEVFGGKAFVKVPVEKARELSSRKEYLRIEGRLRYEDPENLRLVSGVLVYETTGERFPFSGGPAAALTAYVPKPAAVEAPVENIRDIPPFGAEPRPEDLAVVIGIEGYQGLPKSEYSRSDAGLFKDYLKALGVAERNIEMVVDDKATGKSVEKAIEAWLPNRVKPESRVIVYYSGHGAPEPKTGEAYLVPYDGDPSYLEVTGYPLKRLYEKLAALGAAEVMVVLDSCFSGSGGRSVLAKGARPLVAMKEAGGLAQNMVVLSATQGAQISTSSPEKGHGVFTYYFLKALRDGKKSIPEIYQYIKPLVEDEAKSLNVQQSPSLRSGGDAAGRFVLRR